MIDNPSQSYIPCLSCNDRGDDWEDASCCCTQVIIFDLQLVFKGVKCSIWSWNATCTCSCSVLFTMSVLSRHSIRCTYILGHETQRPRHWFDIYSQSLCLENHIQRWGLVVCEVHRFPWAIEATSTRENFYSLDQTITVLTNAEEVEVLIVIMFAITSSCTTNDTLTFGKSLSNTIA